MLSRLRSTLTSLIFLEEEEALSTTRAMASLLPVAIALMVLLIVFPLLAGDFSQRLGVGAPVLLVWATAGWLLRRGKVRAASLIFIAGTWAVATYAVITRDGVRAPAYILYLVLITYAAFLVTPAAALAVFAASLLVGLGTVVAAQAGALPVSSVAHTPITLYATYSACMVMVILVVLRVTTAYRDAFGKLRSSEGKFRSLVETTSDWIWEVDQHGVYIYASPKVHDLLGYEPAEVLGRTPYDLMPPEEAERVSAQVRDNFAQALPISHLENRNLHKDGHEVVLETSGVPVFDEHGAFRGFRGIDRDMTEQKRAEEALRESEERFRAIVESTRDWIWFAGVDGIHSYSNRATHDLLGYAPEEIVGKPAFAFMHPDDVPLACSQMERATAARGGWSSLVIRWRRRDGSYRYLESTAAPAFGPTGDLLGWYGVDRDVTERKEAEEALRESEEMYRALFEMLPVGATIHRNRRLVLANPACVAMLRAPDARSVIGEEITRYVGEEARQQVEAHLRAQRHAGPGAPEHFFTLLRRMDGEEFPAEVFAADILYQGRPATQVVALDVSEQVRMQEALRDSEAHLRALFAAMGDVILVIDAEGRYLEIAPTKPDPLYRPAEEVLGKTVHEILPPQQADYFVEHIRQALGTGRTTQVEYSLPIGGQEYCFSATISPLSSDAVMAVARDVTAIVEQRNRLLAAERARADLAQHLNEEVNHRARNNLAMVSGLLQMQALQEPNSELAARLREAVARMRSFVDIHEKIYATGAEEADLLEVIQQVATTLRSVFSATAAEFSVAGASGLLPTRAVTNLAVITNELMTNALKHGGAGAGRAIEVKVRIDRAEGRLRISVWNSGNPVPDGFEAAAQRGMGLRLVTAFAEQYGGSFTVRPAEGGTLAELAVEEAALES